MKLLTFLTLSFFSIFALSGPMKTYLCETQFHNYKTFQAEECPTHHQIGEWWEAEDFDVFDWECKNPGSVCCYFTCSREEIETFVECKLIS